MDADRPAGSASLELVKGVRQLHQEDAVVDAMLSGWVKQQVGGRRLLPRTADVNVANVRRFVTFTNVYPWQWTAAHMDEWTSHFLSEQHRKPSTVRNFESSIRNFCGFITSPHYEWAAECEKRFGTHPIQICLEWNTARHVDEYEGDPSRRPLTRQEVQSLLDFADDQVERASRSGRKGALTAYRDATVLKLLYGWGLRCNEAMRLDLVDFYRNAKAPEFGRFGVIHVRYGKGSRGSGPRRRPVVSVMPWAVEALEDYIANIRPRFGFPDHPALFVTERGQRMRPRELQDRFASYREAGNLDPALTPHCLRHSYVSHLIEDGADPDFVRQQVGHRFRSTTGIYTTVSTDFMNVMMRQAIEKAFTDDEGKEGAG